MLLLLLYAECGRESESLSEYEIEFWVLCEDESWYGQIRKYIYSTAENEAQDVRKVDCQS